MARTMIKAPKATPIKTAVRPVASTVKPAVKPKVSAVKQPGYTTPVVKPTTKKY